MAQVVTWISQKEDLKVLVERLYKTAMKSKTIASTPWSRELKEMRESWSKDEAWDSPEEGISEGGGRMWSVWVLGKAEECEVWIDAVMMW